MDENKPDCRPAVQRLVDFFTSEMENRRDILLSDNDNFDLGIVLGIYERFLFGGRFDCAGY